MVAKGGSFGGSALGRNASHRRTGLDPEPIVDGTPQLLLASQVAFRGLNRNVPQEELNLIEFAAGPMTESRACAPKIVRRQLVDVGAARGCSDDIPEHLGRHPAAPNAPGFVDRAE